MTQEGVPQKVEDLYNAVHDRRTLNVMDYKEDSIREREDGTYEIVPRGKCQ